MISHLPGLGGGDGQLTSGQPLTEERFIAKIRKALAASILPLDKKLRYGPVGLLGRHRPMHDMIGGVARPVRRRKIARA